MILLKSRCTNLPDSENHFENKEWELISSRRVCVYLYSRCELSIKKPVGPTFHRCERRMESFWASARQSEVLPVPGGPCKRTTRFHETRLTMSQISTHITRKELHSLTVYVRIAKHQCRVDIIQKLHLDTICVYQRIPQSLPASVR